MSQMLDPVTQNHVRQAAAALADEFAGIFSEETIERYIAESVDLLGRRQDQRLRPRSRSSVRARAAEGARARRRGSIAKDMPEVLFVCVHNAGRSQMAAGLVKLRSEGRIHVRSAGSDPGEEINPAVVAGDGGGRSRHERGVPEAPDRRGRPRRRRRDHDGLRRRLPDLPGQAVRGLGARRSGRPGSRHGPAHPGRDRRARADD